MKWRRMRRKAPEARQAACVSWMRILCGKVRNAGGTAGLVFPWRPGEAPLALFTKHLSCQLRTCCMRRVDRLAAALPCTVSGLHAHSRSNPPAGLAPVRGMPPDAGLARKKAAHGAARRQVLRVCAAHLRARQLAGAALAAAGCAAERSCLLACLSCILAMRCCILS